MLLLLALVPAARSEEGPREAQPLLLPLESSTATARGAAVSSAPAAVSTAPVAAIAVSTRAVAVSTAAAAPLAASSAAPAGLPAAQAEPSSIYGTPLDPKRGPWLVGEVLVRGNQSVSTYTILERLRARRGALYTPTDLALDLKEALAVPGVLGARAEVYAMGEEPVPANYASIVVSTMMARILLRIDERPPLPGLAPPKADSSPTAARVPATPVSGVVLTPTAYRGAGRYNTPGLGADINAAYYIGRLYGKNSVSSHPTNYIDRVGLWFLTFDGKAQLQSEGAWRPAVAVGGQGTYMLRDSPQPSLQSNTLSVSVSQKSNKTFSGAYVVASKNIRGVRSSLGYMEGNAGEEVAFVTEFLSPQALQFLYGKGTDIHASSKSTLFGSVMLIPKPQYPLAVEFIKPNGMVLNPILLNFKLGYFLKLNFDLAYLRFQGGWDLLGTFQFRFNQYPRL